MFVEYSDVCVNVYEFAANSTVRCVEFTPEFSAGDTSFEVDLCTFIHIFLYSTNTERF